MPAAAEGAHEGDGGGEAAVEDVYVGALFVEEAGLDGSDVQEADGAGFVLVEDERY